MLSDISWDLNSDAEVTVTNEEVARSTEWETSGGMEKIPDLLGVDI